MKLDTSSLFAPCRVLCLIAFCAGFVLPLPAFSATVDLTKVPLANSTTTSVLPNLMFILDNSGSMGQDYTPDYMSDIWGAPSTGDLNCRDSGDYDGNYTVYPYINSLSDTTRRLDLCVVGDPPYMSSDMNPQYYNPAIRYEPGYDPTLAAPLPGLNGNMASQTNPASVRTDPYNKQNYNQLWDSATTVDITTAYPDRLWCTKLNPTSAEKLNTAICRKNSAYLYPDSTFKYGRTSGWPNQRVTEYMLNYVIKPLVGAPYYYSVTPSEYCTSPDLKVCVAAIAPSGIYTFPAKSRWCSTLALTTCQAVKTSVYQYPRYIGTSGVGYTAVAPYTFARTDIVPGTTSYPKAASRTDCAGATCTYSEEITNFANWYAYHRTRMQSMKTAASHAFRLIDSRYRVGFFTINYQSTNYLPIAKFDNLASGSEAINQKSTWYLRLFNAIPSGSTPLRSTLSTVGRIFAGKKPVGTSDPMQYSCQQNFSLLTTDGYWNDSSSSVLDIGGGTIGNLDGGTTPRPMYEGPTASSATLADTAKYYYDTDLRTTALTNCTGSLGLDVCEDNVFVSNTDNNLKQHMTTFTLGLGVDGTLLYSSDYKTATSGDYYNIVNGAANWSVPVSGNETTVDDLWHAAVNGQGTYFSAKDPKQLVDGLNTALAAIGSKVGAGAAAATSTLNPVTGDNYAYVASYITAKWQGNLEARTVNTVTGLVSEAATWCVENTTAGSCAAPGTIVADNGGSSTIYNCETPMTAVDAATNCLAPTGIYDGTVCKEELPIACSGTLKSKIGATSDTRSIYTNNAGSLVSFEYANLNATDFDSTKLSGLSQWLALTPTQQAAAVGANLVNFIRGQTGFEDRGSNIADNRIYRYREAALGDIVESRPTFVGKPFFNYSDPGYEAFKTAQAGRGKTVFVGANDGMLHAFEAETGEERWAYVPSMVVPELWRLADKSYTSNHRYYVNGSPTIADVCTANCSNIASATWRTILVAGLGGGGRGYYALDVTNPAAPLFLWEFNAASAGGANMGYGFGAPEVAKLSDGTWVVLLTSGYNNIGDGKGYLYVLDPATGSVLKTIGTSVGNTTTPSGLAKIATWADDPYVNAAATFTYGGDLLGNLWRFDINAGTVTQFATLLDPSGNAQPITTRPELGTVVDSSGTESKVIFTGTGKYLENSDLINTQLQTLYAIKDLGNGSTLSNARSSLVQQTLTQTGAGRTSSTNAVDFSTGRGWYIDLPDTGERQNVDGTLIRGTLLVPTTVPTNTVCSPGGYSWFNYFDYRTGSAVVDSAGALVSQKTDAPIVGINVVYIDGNPVISVVTSDKPTPEMVGGVGTGGLSSGGTGSATSKTRVIWRELVQ